MAFKDAYAKYLKTFVNDCDVPDTTRNPEVKARSALNSLRAMDYSYDDWKNIGISFKCAGGTCEDWLAWCAIDASRYDEKAAVRLYESVDVDGPITDKTLWHEAWGHGWKWRDDEYEPLKPVRKIPKHATFNDGGEQTIAQLNAMFRPDENVSIVTYARFDEKHDKWTPGERGRIFNVAKLCEDIRANGLDSALGGYNHDAGVWIRVNPVKDARGADDSVTAFRNALVESDDMPLKDQERMMFELRLPSCCITDSGGKSLHAIVRIDADGREHYRDRVMELHDVCKASGLSLDDANKNPSRLTRLAGAQRGDREQTLFHLSTGAKDFRTWKLEDNNTRLSYDYGIEPLDITTHIHHAPEVIQGVMRKGDKACVAGASKSYKSFALIQLAIAVATGGKWFGWQCAQGRVLYLNCEIRGESFRQRVKDVATMLGVDVAVTQGNIDVWNMRGKAQPLSKSKEHIVEQAKGRGYDIIILDPIYKLFDGDENKAQDVSEFMLHMDDLAMSLNASVVYCHHHSKGAKGDVSAQDRFSGSGVFARDCDVLVDIAKLDTSKTPLTEYKWSETASAWRIETVLRDFAPKQPVNVVFDYPLHHVDTTGYLDEYSVYSPATIGGNKSAVARSAKADKRADELKKYLDDYYESTNEPMKVPRLADVFGVKRDTIKNWVNERMEGYKIDYRSGTNIVIPN